MIGLQDIENIEGEAETAEDYYTSIQRAINSLEAWKFQGSYGRAMMDAIEDGRVMLGRHDTRDYWGNHIPSREQVDDGTKGSRLFVAEKFGEDWAELIAAVE
jgi:hypothetical protein